MRCVDRRPVGLRAVHDRSSIRLCRAWAGSPRRPARAGPPARTSVDPPRASGWVRRQPRDDVIGDPEGDRADDPPGGDSRVSDPLGSLWFLGRGRWSVGAHWVAARPERCGGDRGDRGVPRPDRAIVAGIDSEESSSHHSASSSASSGMGTAVTIRRFRPATGWRSRSWALGTDDFGPGPVHGLGVRRPRADGSVAGRRRRASGS